MRKIFAVFAVLALAGCATVEHSEVGGRHMVVVSNSGWYLFNVIPVASGNPEKVNKPSSVFFSETATLENNIGMLDRAIKVSGAKSATSLKSFWSDESVFVVFLKRHVIHTSAELVFDKAGDKNKQR